jgi:small GTP-binding protein
MSFLVNLFKRKVKQINLTICGLDKAGKTTIVNYLIHGEFRQTMPTMGLNRDVINFKNFRFNVFDLGGQKDFRPMWSDVNEKSDALIYIVDSTDFSRLEESKEIFHNIINTQIDHNIPTLILLNKIDLPGGMKRMDFIQKFGLLDRASEFNWGCFETSAKTGQGIAEAFLWYVGVLEGMN